MEHVQCYLRFHHKALATQMKTKVVIYNNETIKNALFISQVDYLPHRLTCL